MHRPFPPLKEQLSTDWMGRPDTNSNARMAKGFGNTVEFLATNVDIARARIPKSFATAIHPGTRDKDNPGRLMDVAAKRPMNERAVAAFVQT